MFVSFFMVSAFSRCGLACFVLVRFCLMILGIWVRCFSLFGWLVVFGFLFRSSVGTILIRCCIICLGVHLGC